MKQAKIDLIKLQAALRKRGDMFDDEITIAEAEGRLADIVSMKVVQLACDVFAGAIISSMEIETDEKF